ncbi:transposase [Campylobacter concisus]|uniref:transposase n=1 Tax=Campylobacter concisus TaxID=199 RepID=UPI000CD9673E|nr:transposase [Campylobacter concisus]
MALKRQTSPDTSVIYIDEFKGNIEKEKYQLAMYDKNRKLVDILINRHSQTIKNIINEFEIQPQVVVMDMFKPFRSIINSNIVQAQIVADKYHVIRQGIWALRDLRVELFNKDNEKYKKLKKILENTK